MVNSLTKAERKKKSLHFQIGSTEKVHTVIVEKPGLWMSEKEIEKIVNDLRRVVQSVGIGDLNYGIFTGAPETLNNGVITIIYDGPNKRPLAFNVMAYMSCELRGQPIQVLHLGLTAIDPTVQAKGFTWTLYGLSTALLLIKNKLRPFWISSVTQVPTVLGKVGDNFSEVFPSPTKLNRRTYDHLELARQIMSEHRSVFGVGAEAEFDEESFVIKNAYTGGSDHLKKTFDESAKYRDERVNEFCRTKLDYGRGDDFLQIGKIDLQTMFQYVYHNLPANGVLIFLMKSFQVLLDTVIAPALQWFSPSKQFEELRPR